MKHRDLAWRCLGGGLIGAAAVLRATTGAETQNVAELAALFLILGGLVLIVQGKRVPAALRVECSRHRMLPQAIRNRRHERATHRAD